MGMPGEDHVDPADDARHLLVHIKAVMGQDHDQFRAFAAHLVNDLLHVLVADAKGIFGEHPAGVCNRHIGERLPDHGNLDAARLEELVRREKLCGLVPFCVEDILAERSIGKPFDQFRDPLGPKREFPVERHRIWLQRVHHVDHVLPLGVVAGVAAVPCIAAIQQQRIRTLGPNMVDNRRNAIQSADTPIPLCK